MNMKKFMAGAVASVMAVSVMAVAASAYDATLGYADGSWTAQDWDTTITVDGDGTYSITSSFGLLPDEETGGEYSPLANGATVFVLDIKGLATDKNAGKGADGFDFADDDFAGKSAFAKAAGIEVSDVKLTATIGGAETDVALDASKIYVGDLEGKGNIRIEIYNEYGAKDSAIDRDAFADVEKFTLTFTIKGIDAPSEPAAGEGEGENPPPPADGEGGNNAPAPGGTAGAGSDPNKDKPAVDTGIEGVAVVAGLAIVAAGAVVVAKKRK